jgi:hypothetical protein
MKHIVLYSELIALVAGLIVLKRLRPPRLQLTVLLLCLIVCVELYALVHKTFFAKLYFSSWLYNISLPLEFGLYCLIFLKEIVYTLWKKVLLFLTLSLLVFSYTVIIFYRPNEFESVNYAAWVILLSIYSLRYIYEQLHSQDISAIWGNLLFYIACGSLIYYLGTLPLHTMWHYLYENYPGIFYPYYYINQALDCIMYLLFAFGYYKSVYGKVKYSN